MEGKSVILSVLIMSLVVAQIQVEAKSCCPTIAARGIYIRCRRAGRTPPFCASISRCRLVPSGRRCPSCCPFPAREVNDYCKLGCESSVCGALTNLEISDASETVNKEALEKCTKACSTLCAKGFQTAADQIELDQIALDQVARDQISLNQIEPDQSA